MKSTRDMTSAELREFRESGADLWATKMRRPCRVTPRKWVYSDIEDTTRAHVRAKVIKMVKQGEGWGMTGPIKKYPQKVLK